MRKHNASSLSPSQSFIHPTALHKTSTIVYDLHSYISKITKAQDNFRSLSEEQQHLLKITQNQTEFHSLLAGILAIDSGIRNMMEREGKIQKILFNLIYQLMKDFKFLASKLENLQTSAILGQTAISDIFQLIVATTSQLVHSTQLDLSKYNTLLESNQIQSLSSPRNFLIKALKDEKQEQKRQIKCLQQKLLQVNNGEQVMRELKRQNEILRRYMNIDCAELLDRLEKEIQMLREQKIHERAIRFKKQVNEHYLLKYH